MESGSCDICNGQIFDVVRQDKWMDADTANWYPVLTCICRRCGHVYQNPRLTFDELSEFYASQKHLSFQVSRGESKGLNAADVEHLTDVVGPGAGRSALEAGCYSGYMLRRLVDSGWVSEGLEPNVDSAAKARAHAICKVHECMLEDFETEQRFDLIFMGGLIEHVASPTSLLLKANKLLNQNGYIYIRTPTGDDLNYETAADLFVLEHIHLFSSNALAMLLEKTGFKLISQHSHPKFPRSVVVIGRKIEDLVTPAPFELQKQHVQMMDRIRAYDLKVQHERLMVNKKIEEINSNSRIAIYGAGSHTDFLLRHTQLGKASISFLIDSNPKKWWTKAYGYQVRPPSGFEKSEIDYVVISSRAFQEEIYERIKSWENENVVILKLYDLVGSRYLDE